MKIKSQKIFILLSVLLSLFTLQAYSQDLNHCSIRSRSCDFYQCAENTFQCGDGGYFKAFAAPYCHLFLSEDFLQKNSTTTQKWLIEVASCLQQSIKQAASENNNLSCQQIRLKAINAHAKCYYETGFCQIPRNDRMLLAKTLIKDTWNDFDILRQGLQIQKLCGPQWQQDLDKF